MSHGSPRLLRQRTSEDDDYDGDADYDYDGDADYDYDGDHPRDGSCDR